MGLLLFLLFKWKRRNLRGKQEILGTLGMTKSARTLKAGKGRKEPRVHVLGCKMLSSTLSTVLRPALQSQHSQDNRRYRAYFPDKKLGGQPTGPLSHNEEVRGWTSRRLSSLYCSVKERKTLSAPTFQGREQVQGQGQFEAGRGSVGGGRGVPIKEDRKITVIGLILGLHQSLFLDPNLCVIWQEKRYLQVHKCQSQFQAGRLPSVTLMRVLK